MLFIDADTLDSIPTISGEDGEEDEHDNLPIIRVRSALQEIDERRTAKLQHMRVIGIVTNKQANFASQLVHMNVRRVNFKWQLGIKIGKTYFFVINLSFSMFKFYCFGFWLIQSF